MILAIIIPPITAKNDFFLSISNTLATKHPVHAPVPGSGIPTKRNKAQYKPRPAFSCSFFPPFSPFSKQNVKNFPIYFLSDPHSKTFLAKKNIVENIYHSAKRRAGFGHLSAETRH